MSVALVLVAIVVQAIALANANVFDATRFFAFFTIQSNLIGVAAFIWLVARRGADRSRGAIDGWYPYPFLNPANGGYGVVAATVVAIIAAFLVLSAITIAIGNARGRATPRPAT